MASGNKSVVVLAPNGRRQTVKVTPNTTILQILEEVCKKQGLKPNEYDLKHYKNVLDTTTIIRFSGLPNNAQLEMCAAQKTRQDSAVTLGVQLENGTRLTGDFTPGDTLFNVLNILCPDELSKDPENIVAVYMRNEIFGIESLKNTSLRSLGLTGGRAMFRIMHRTLEQLKTQANVSSVIPSKPQEEKPYVRRKIEVVSERKKEMSPPRKQMTDLIKEEKENIKKQNKAKPEPMEIDQKTKAKEKVEFVEKEKKKQLTLPDNFIYLGERNAMAFSLEQSESFPHDELPDEFFELTIQDAKKLYRDLKSKRQEMEERPLQTAQLRNLEKGKKLLRQLNQYGRAVIRVQFPDRSVLQGSFRPLETIKHVHDFIREYLQNSNSQFYLYTTPPKTVLDPESTLVDCECVPSAVLYFGTTQSVDNGRYLKDDVFNRFVSSSLASLSASKSIMNHKREVEPDTPVDDTDVNLGASTSKAPQQHVDVSPMDVSSVPSQRQVVANEEPKGKVPKWFKPNK